MERLEKKENIKPIRVEKLDVSEVRRIDIVIEVTC